MNQLSGVLKIHFTGRAARFAWLGFPWLILLFSFGVNVLISALAGGTTGLYTGGLSSIYVYMFIAGVVAVNGTFPFALGLSVRRIAYFLGTSLMFCAISAADAVLLTLLALIEHDLTGGWGVNLHFFHLPYLSDGSPIEQVIILFSVMLHLCFLAFVVASLYRRTGMLGIYIFSTGLFGIFSLLGLAFTYFNWWGDVFNWLAQQTAFMLALWLLPVTALYALVSYLLLRKATA
jgi:hypothetical protein